MASDGDTGEHRGGRLWRFLKGYHCQKEAGVAATAESNLNWAVVGQVSDLLAQLLFFVRQGAAVEV